VTRCMGIAGVIIESEVFASKDLFVQADSSFILRSSCAVFLRSALLFLVSFSHFGFLQSFTL
jgi:hypothetical protein